MSPNISGLDYLLPSSLLALDYAEDNSDSEELKPFPDQKFIMIKNKYHCQGCPRIFNSECSVKRHLKECGIEPRYQCAYCQYTGKRKFQITRHTKIKHKNQNVEIIDLFV
ncbi:GSCOCG00002835001-RA-CDS [Cotesia congregata]|nr:GSCOCG00002835001-RA-CDS [Cotesia congregata]